MFEYNFFEEYSQQDQNILLVFLMITGITNVTANYAMNSYNTKTYAG